jgi:hypothetical protein
MNLVVTSSFFNCSDLISLILMGRRKIYSTSAIIPGQINYQIIQFDPETRIAQYFSFSFMLACTIVLSREYTHYNYD